MRYKAQGSARLAKPRSLLPGLTAQDSRLTGQREVGAILWARKTLGAGKGHYGPRPGISPFWAASEKKRGPQVPYAGRSPLGEGEGAGDFGPSPPNTIRPRGEGRFRRSRAAQPGQGGGF